MSAAASAGFTSSRMEPDGAASSTGAAGAAFPFFIAASAAWAAAEGALKTPEGRGGSAGAASTTGAGAGTGAGTAFGAWARVGGTKAPVWRGAGAAAAGGTNAPV